MAKPPNQELINRLMMEMEEQREIIERAKDAGKIMRELNRLIAILGGNVEDLPVRKQSRKERVPVVPPNEDGSYTCPECGQSTFRNPQGISAHRKIKHGVSGTYADRREEA